MQLKNRGVKLRLNLLRIDVMQINKGTSTRLRRLSTQIFDWVPVLAKDRKQYQDVRYVYWSGYSWHFRFATRRFLDLFSRAWSACLPYEVEGPFPPCSENRRQRICKYLLCYYCSTYQCSISVLVRRTTLRVSSQYADG